MVTKIIVEFLFREDVDKELFYDELSRIFDNNSYPNLDMMCAFGDYNENEIQQSNRNE